MKTKLSRLLALALALALCLGLLPLTALAANTVVIKKVVYTNGSDGTASAAITFTYTGDKITWIDPMIGKSEGSYEYDLDTQDALNLPDGWALKKNEDGSYTLIASPLHFTMSQGVKPAAGTEAWVGVSVYDQPSAGDIHDQLKITVPGEGKTVEVIRGGGKLKIAKIPPDAETRYNGKEQTLTTSEQGVILSNNKATEPGTYTVTATLQSGYQWEDGTTGPKYPKWTIKKAQLTGAYFDSLFEYNGQVQKPQNITVHTSTFGLNPGPDDYDVIYLTPDSRDAGEYRIQIVAKGAHFEGTVDDWYEIAPAEIEKVELSATTFVYNGEVQKPTVTAVTSTLGSTIPAGEYTLVWSDENSTEPGTYTVTATASSENVEGEAEATYTILAKVIDLSKAEPTNLRGEDEDYTKKEIEDVGLKDTETGTVLKKDEEYTETITTERADDSTENWVKTFKPVEGVSIGDPIVVKGRKADEAAAVVNYKVDEGLETPANFKTKDTAYGRRGELHTFTAPTYPGLSPRPEEIEVEYGGHEGYVLYERCEHPKYAYEYEDLHNGYTHKVTCGVCGAVIDEAAGHFAESSGIYKDEHTHTFKCPCGANVEEDHVTNYEFVFRDAESHATICSVCHRGFSKFPHTWSNREFYAIEVLRPEIIRYFAVYTLLFRETCAANGCAGLRKGRVSVRVGPLLWKQNAVERIMREIAAKHYLPDKYKLDSDSKEFTLANYLMMWMTGVNSSNLSYDNAVAQFTIGVFTDLQKDGDTVEVRNLAKSETEKYFPRDNSGNSNNKASGGLLSAGSVNSDVRPLTDDEESYFQPFDGHIADGDDKLFLIGPDALKNLDLKAGENTLSITLFDENGDPICVFPYVFEVDGFDEEGNPWVTVPVPDPNFVIEDSDDIPAEVTLDQDTFEFDGQAHVPAATVTNAEGTVTYTEGTDYTLSYFYLPDNTAVWEQDEAEPELPAAFEPVEVKPEEIVAQGRYAVVVTGLGDALSGTTYADFTIVNGDEIVPTEATFDKYSDSKNHGDVTVSMLGGGFALAGITCDGEANLPEDGYDCTACSVILKTSFLSTLAVGEHKFGFDFVDVYETAPDVDTRWLTLTVIDSTPGTVYFGDPGPTTYTATLTETVHGKVTVSPTAAAEGATVTVTATPDTGYALAQLTVTGPDGKPVELTKHGDGTYSYKQPAGNVTVTATFKFANPFVDVAEGDYFYDAVLWAVETGVTKGTDDTHFSPNGLCSRAETVTFLWRVEGCPEPGITVNPFVDVQADAYYYKAVLWAVETGVTTGTDDMHFSPAAPTTREQFATFLYRCAKSHGKGFTGTWAFPLNFPDAAGVSDWAYEAMCWMVTNCVVNGMDGMLNPQGNALRAHVVCMIHRYCSLA